MDFSDLDDCVFYDDEEKDEKQSNYSSTKKRKRDGDDKVAPPKKKFRRPKRRSKKSTSNAQSFKKLFNGRNDIKPIANNEREKEKNKNISDRISEAEELLSSMKKGVDSHAVNVEDKMLDKSVESNDSSDDYDSEYEGILYERKEDKPLTFYEEIKKGIEYGREHDIFSTYGRSSASSISMNIANEENDETNGYLDYEIPQNLFEFKNKTKIDI